MVKYEIKNTHYLPRIYDSEERRVRNLTRQVDEVEQEVTYLSLNVPILESGLIPARYLPSYVDDIIEGYYYNNAFYKDSAHTQLITGETGKIYVDLSTDLTYRWSGSAYVEVSKSIITGVKGDAESNYRVGNVNLTAANIGLGNVANLDLSKAIKGITRSGTTFTYTCLDGTTGTFTQQDNNTTYSAGTGLSLTNTTFALAESGATAGTYNNVTVDKYGRVTSGSNEDYYIKYTHTISKNKGVRITFTGAYNAIVTCRATGGTTSYLTLTGTGYSSTAGSGRNKWVKILGGSAYTWTDNSTTDKSVEILSGNSDYNTTVTVLCIMGTVSSFTEITELSGDARTDVVAKTGIGVSNFTNDAGYLTSHQDISGKKNVLTPVTIVPNASGSNGTINFISGITQDAQGVISPVKDFVRTMGAASSSAAGTAGLVPAPAKGKQDSFLKGDGTWAIPTDTNDKTTLSSSTTESYRKILLHYDTNTTKNADVTSATNRVYAAKDVSVQPSTGKIFAKGFVTDEGTSDGFVKGDGSLDTGNYKTVTLTDAALYEEGLERLTLGNSTKVSSANSKYGALRLYTRRVTDSTATNYNITTRYGEIQAGTSNSPLTANRTYSLPNKSGTIALTTDIPTDDVYTVSGVVTSNNIIKCASSGYYYAFVPADINKISSVVGFYATCSSPYSAQWQADITSSKLNVPLSRSYIVDGYINSTTRKQNCFVFKFGTSDPGTVGYQIIYSRSPLVGINIT